MGNKNNLSKMIHFLARIIGISIAVALTLFVAVTALGIYWPDIQAYRYKLEAERFKKEVDAEKARIEAQKLQNEMAQLLSNHIS